MFLYVMQVGYAMLTFVYEVKDHIISR